MRNYFGTYIKRERGSVLVMTVIAIVILLLVGMGLLTITYGVRMRAIKFKNQTVAMLAAEAGYERGIFWMNEQPSILASIANNVAGCSGTINFGNSSCSYVVQFNTYIAGKPVFKVVSTGTCGVESKVVNVDVIQNPGGWDMARCRIPTSPTSDGEVVFASNEIINIPVHINKYNDNPDVRDIYFSGNPRFLRSVSMGESRHSSNGTDKYSSVMGAFEGGISWDNPNVRITDAAAVQQKLDQFKDSTNAAYKFADAQKPVATVPASLLPASTAGHLWPAVQIEPYSNGGVGMIKITNNCTVVGYQRSNTRDYKLATTGGDTYTRYDIYAYHYKDDTQPVLNVPVTSTYVQQTFAGQQSEPGGQIFVDGNVVLGSDAYDQLVVNGKVTIVATGNIWIGDSIVADGAHTTDASGVPTTDNPNAIGLIAGGVVKVVDPGMSGYAAGGTNNYPGPATTTPLTDPIIPTKTYSYAPVGNGVAGSNDRILSTPPTATNPANATVVEAAVTCGGGGWGAENVLTDSGSYGGRKQAGGSVQDALILRGTIVEAVRGIVGRVNSDGFIKQYYLDSRLLAGVLPGNIWFGGKFIPAPAGWHDYRQ